VVARCDPIRPSIARLIGKPCTRHCLHHSLVPTRFVTQHTIGVRFSGTASEARWLLLYHLATTRRCGCKSNFIWVLYEVTVQEAEVGTARPAAISADNWSHKPLRSISSLEEDVFYCHVEDKTIKDCNPVRFRSNSVVVHDLGNYKPEVILRQRNDGRDCFSHWRCWLYGPLPARRSGLLTEIQTEASSLSQIFCTSMILFVQNIYSSSCSPPRSSKSSVRCKR
jgi:hypothetical protein